MDFGAVFTHITSRCLSCAEVEAFKSREVMDKKLQDPCIST
jgi:hypothetical protein